jgi:hypothetical protein
MSKRKRALLGATGIFADPLPEPSTEGSNRPDREGRVPMPFWTGLAAKRQLRMLAAEKDTTQQALSWLKRSTSSLSDTASRRLRDRRAYSPKPDEAGAMKEWGGRRSGRKPLQQGFSPISAW